MSRLTVSIQNGSPKSRLRTFSSTGLASASSAVAWSMRSCWSIWRMTMSRRLRATSSLATGLLTAGAWMVPASTAASATVSSPIGFEK
jgi:hypothetical protein